ncbi:MAG: hypothetical protein K2X77_16585 [Candidatus Obscuribacterales bacterium]|nr:hypothetical protein [Candidatus Obscuribacterales bacterium]
MSESTIKEQVREVERNDAGSATEYDALDAYRGMTIQSGDRSPSSHSAPLSNLTITDASSSTGAFDSVRKGGCEIIPPRKISHTLPNGEKITTLEYLPGTYPEKNFPREEKGPALKEITKDGNGWGVKEFPREENGPALKEITRDGNGMGNKDFSRNGVQELQTMDSDSLSKKLSDLRYPNNVEEPVHTPTGKPDRNDVIKDLRQSANHVSDNFGVGGCTTTPEERRKEQEQKWLNDLLEDKGNWLKEFEPGDLKPSRVLEDIQNSIRSAAPIKEYRERDFVPVENSGGAKLLSEQELRRMQSKNIMEGNSPQSEHQPIPTRTESTSNDTRNVPKVPEGCFPQRPKPEGVPRPTEPETRNIPAPGDGQPPRSESVPSPRPAETSTRNLPRRETGGCYPQPPKPEGDLIPPRPSVSSSRGDQLSQDPGNPTASQRSLLQDYLNREHAYENSRDFKEPSSNGGKGTVEKDPISKSGGGEIFKEPGEPNGKRLPPDQYPGEISKEPREWRSKNSKEINIWRIPRDPRMRC